MSTDFLVDTMDAKVKRTRRRHSEEFREEVVAASGQAGVSVSAVALANGLNTNLLRRWIKEHREHLPANGPDRTDATPSQAKSALMVPVTIESVEPSDLPLPSEIRIDIRRGPTTVQMAWPLAHAAMLGEVMKDLLR